MLLVQVKMVCGSGGHSEVCVRQQTDYERSNIVPEMLKKKTHGSKKVLTSLTIRSIHETPGTL
jgi:hypothetical protein